MKTLLALLLTLSPQAFAATISVIAPCEDQVAHEVSLTLESDIENIGELSVQAFEEMKLPFAGTARGMNSILNTPTGLEAMDIISDEEMFAYGWCYSVNGFSPEVFADEVKAQEDDHVLWWYGYAHYQAGQWLTQCTPSYTRRDSDFCQNL